MAGFKGRPSNKRPIVEAIRRKCVGCGKIKEVKFKKYWIPSYSDLSEIPVYLKNGPKTNRLERKGAIVKYYCEYECYQEHL
jgi:hypothetical protein|tara:strand:+ start:34 stop:276 length:243 start_codon:yes stop_codon:yes gene_type:complete